MLLLTILLPLLVFVLLGLFGKRMKEPWPGVIASGLVLASFVLGVILLAGGGAKWAIRHRLLSPDWSGELAKLQERVPPVPWSQIWLELTRELGCPLEEVFAHLEPEPLAAASIGQVHRGVLRNGGAVVVKVQRPEVYRQVQLDLGGAPLAGSLCPAPLGGL